MKLTDSIEPKAATWEWRGFELYYQTAGTQGPPVVLIHGFGASSFHWRKNIAVLAQTHRVYALDLIGFGQSAKPQPGSFQEGQHIEYQFETWGEQVVAFCQEVIGAPAFLVGNSIGAIVTLQAGVLAPDWVTGIVLINCSLRLLHERKRGDIPWYRRWSTPLIQKLLTYRALGHLFFTRLAQPKVIRKILLQAYGRMEAVTDELVEMLLQPARDPGAADVFLAFISYSQGPLAEDLLPQIQVPVYIIWGAADPWEPITLGQEFAHFPTVQEFVPLDGVGHCPQDEAPELVNPLLQKWAAG